MGSADMEKMLKVNEKKCSGEGKKRFSGSKKKKKKHFRTE
jgi:hypothetical protein